MTKTGRLHIAVKTRYYKLLWQQENHCFYCHDLLTLATRTLDHMIPRARGGSNSFRNIVLACRPCNNAKADLTISEFMEFCAVQGGLDRVKLLWGERPDSRLPLLLTLGIESHERNTARY